MTFLFASALLALSLVGAPYFAHRLRRRRADAVPFAAAHLVPASPPRARRRAQLEDKGLFFVRALAVVALALLGASPFVRCSRLSLARSSGASVALAIVVDDSMSMRAKLGAKTRFARAREGASQLLASTREGDAVTVVLAGDPPRVALAPTTDLATARAVVESLEESDRATDLEGALVLARGLVLGLPQVDRRVVVLSDLADGSRATAPLGEGSSVPVWNALPELRADGNDCAILRADRTGARVRVRVACGPGGDRSAFGPRKVALFAGERRLGEAEAPTGDLGDAVVTLPLDLGASLDVPGAVVARLLGVDSIEADDSATVVTEAAPGSVAVVAPPGREAAATGGAPVVEQALAALQLDVGVRPLPQVPDRGEDLDAFAGLVLDDPPGLTPEERRAVATFVERGGIVLLALGPQAAAAPLGASLEPFLTRPVRWEATTSRGADPGTASGPLLEAASTLSELRAPRRAVTSAEDAANYTTLAAWTDHAPLAMRRTIGRGEVWVVTLPFALDTSDLTLRPAFLALLEGWVDAAHERTTPRHGEVGQPWTFNDAREVTVHGPPGDPTPVVKRERQLRAVPARVGMYRVTVDGRDEFRVSEPVQREVDLRPRRLPVDVAGRGLGDDRASVDASPFLAFALLFLVSVELVLRARARGALERAAQGA